MITIIICKTNSDEFKNHIEGELNSAHLVFKQPSEETNKNKRVLISKKKTHGTPKLYSYVNLDTKDKLDSSKGMRSSSTGHLKSSIFYAKHIINLNFADHFYRWSS